MSTSANGSDEGGGVRGEGGSSGAGAGADSVSLGNPLLVKRAPEKLEPLSHPRHHAAGRRAIAGCDLQRRGQAGHRPPAGPARRRRHRGRLPLQLPGDFAAVTAIAEQVEGPVIAGLSRCFEEDVRSCARALAKAKRARIHVFIGTSPIHREGQLRMTQAEVYERSVSMVRLAKSFQDDVEYSAMDTTRTEPDYLAQVLNGCIEAGATTINLADTVGYATPDEWRQLIEWLYAQVPAMADVTVSVHCHNDLGLATANSLIGIRAGARQVEGCINGIGERAGNTALEEVAMAVRLHPEVFGVATRFDHTQLFRTSRLVSQLSGMLVQANKAVVGGNAFAHQAGIHQDGMLKDRRTFEIMEPNEVGAGPAWCSAS